MAQEYTIPVVDLKGQSLGNSPVSEKLFGVTPNEAVLHFVCEGQRFRFYKKTACTKTRSAVRGTTKKARKQKGSGSGRQGTIRAPHWVGGGVVFGPSAIKHEFKVNKKIRELALASVLSDRYSSGQIRLLKADALKAPKTQTLSAFLENLSLSQGKVAFVLSAKDSSLLEKSVRNIKNVSVLKESQWTPLDFIKTDAIIFSESALKALSERFVN